MNKRQIMRQGDVLLVPITKSPINYATPTPSDRVRGDGSVVLAFGEVTGHAHVANGPGVELEIGRDRQWSGQQFEVLAVNADTTITHEEHGTLPLRKGMWQIIHQREYSPEAITRVYD